MNRICVALGGMLVVLTGCKGDQGVSINREAPSVSITSPSDDDIFAEGAVVTLEATVEDFDPLDRLELSWSSDRMGTLSEDSELVGDTQVRLDTARLELGVHEITLEVTDTEAQVGRDSVTLEIIENSAPVVSLDSPSEPAYELGTTIEVEGIATDREQPDETLFLDWSFDGVHPDEAPNHPDLDGTVAFSLEDVELGEYVLELEVTDSVGDTATVQVEFVVVEADADGDGYVTELLGGDDCDDGDEAVNPGADEICNGIDDDCDGDADSDAIDMQTIYTDSDGDGYGDPDTEREGCPDEEDAVTVAEDCLDTDETVNPDATEICDDGLDNDCDGGANDCALSGDVVFDSADLVIYGVDSSDLAGSAVFGGQDYDGDGCDDIAAGSPDASTAYVYPGCQGGGVASFEDSIAWIQGVEGDLTGGALAGLDLFDDGLGELLVGVSSDDMGSSAQGAAYLFQGPLTGALTFQDAELTVSSENEDLEGGNLGQAVAVSADVDGDGIVELVLAAPEADTDQGGTKAGAVWLLSAEQTGTVDLDDADYELAGDDGQDLVGFSVSAAGDLDGDGKADLLVGAPLHNNSSGAYSGQAYIFLGDDLSGSHRTGQSEAILTGISSYDELGTYVAIADVDGDGQSEALVGAPKDDEGASNAGRLYVVDGGASGSISVDSSGSSKAIITGTDTNGRLGHAFSAGDTDGDGDDELWLAAPGGERSDGLTTGQAYLFFGPLTGALDTASASFTASGEGSSDAAGTAVSADGDVNGDGLHDLIVGAPGEDAVGSNAGAVYIVYGEGL